jgi:acetyl esterase
MKPPRELPVEPRSFRPRIVERAELAVARTLLGLPPRLQVLLSGRRQIVIDGQRLDPSMQLLLTLSGEAWRTRGSLSVDAARKRVRWHALRYAGLAPRVRALRELEIDGPVGPLRARHYVPLESSRPAPLLVFFHGGGFALGDLDTHDGPCRVLCERARVHVLSVEYRLAPEHPYPAAADDALAAFRFAQAHAVELGADPLRIAVVGDSAGGNLAAVVAQRTRGERPPRLQVLLYPTTDLDPERPSRRLFADGFFLTAEDMDQFDRWYGCTRRDDQGRSPLMAADLSGLCPALLVTCGFDPLRDEGELYARALEAAGNRVEAWREPGLIHGFLNMTALSETARQALERLIERLTSALRAAD